MTTVDRSLASWAHKRDQGACLIDSLGPNGEDSFSATTRLGTADQLFAFGDDAPEVMPIAETLRQIAIILAHTVYGVPEDAAFVMGRLEARSGPGAVARRNPQALVRCRDIKRRGSDLSRMQVDVSFRSGGEEAGSGTGGLVVLPAAAYQRVRGGVTTKVGRTSAGPQLAPAEVGRERPQDVVLRRGANAHSYLLHIDTGHPIYFDHPLDHVPGMLVLEAARQAHVAHFGTRPASLAATFHSYLELAPDPVVVVEDLKDGRSMIQVAQDGRPAVTVDLTR